MTRFYRLFTLLTVVLWTASASAGIQPIQYEAPDDTPAHSVDELADSDFSSRMNVDEERNINDLAINQMTNTYTTTTPTPEEVPSTDTMTGTSTETNTTVETGTTEAATEMDTDPYSVKPITKEELDRWKEGVRRQTISADVYGPYEITKDAKSAAADEDAARHKDIGGYIRTDHTYYQHRDFEGQRYYAFRYKRVKDTSEEPTTPETPATVPDSDPSGMPDAPDTTPVPDSEPSGMPGYDGVPASDAGVMDVGSETATVADDVSAPDSDESSLAPPTSGGDINSPQFAAWKSQFGADAQIVTPGDGAILTKAQFEYNLSQTAEGRDFLAKHVFKGPPYTHKLGGVAQAVYFAYIPKLGVNMDSDTVNAPEPEPAPDSDSSYMPGYGGSTVTVPDTDSYSMGMQ